jgi:hypothetical protein
MAYSSLSWIPIPFELVRQHNPLPCAAAWNDFSHIAPPAMTMTVYQHSFLQHFYLPLHVATTAALLVAAAVFQLSLTCRAIFGAQLQNIAFLECDVIQKPKININ